MDSAYDHIQEENYAQDPTQQQSASGESTHQETTSNFNAEFQDAYKAISTSPWAARLGGFLGTVKKQGEQYYDTASKQYAPLTKNATAGVSTLISHARNLSVQAADAATASSSTDKSAISDQPKEEVEVHPDRPESLPADIVREAEGILSRFRSEATKRLKDIEKAEDAADEALLKFGSNIRNFLREAVTIAPPVSGSEADKNGDVLFESKDSSGKKVVHATRFDAQLHVIHSTLDSFLKDPASPEWEKWKAAFDVEAKTGAIAKDLEKHQELRSAMEKCVPEKVEYGVFWCRYYFLRHVIESEEVRRREMLKASAPIAEEEVAWDEDSDDDSDDEESKPTTKPETKPTPSPIAKTATSPAAKATPKTPAKEETSDESEEESSDEEEEDSDDDSDDSTPSRPTTATPRTAAAAAAKAAQATSASASANLAASTKTLKPAQPRRSNDEKSVADSDASYDVVSGATSRAPGSPMTEKKKVVEEEESDEEDWE
ncbi:hypothetical protein T440DRAFT_471030 [Plenodomus tracheiphilus IPT5]|uniref:BSD domain-containing protein n=1 Tax=Plenodomus tracheiphilus IPT5 TaxID=1408161 RepID=A0A6A7AZD7_9PLEO|nr:hypothetical protein T440DRAFT_471030 [Plenodomus tracheiphilus IPT5]